MNVDLRYMHCPIFGVCANLSVHCNGYSLSDTDGQRFAHGMPFQPGKPCAKKNIQRFVAKKHIQTFVKVFQQVGEILLFFCMEQAEKIRSRLSLINIFFR